jgi:hypothetical protein
VLIGQAYQVQTLRAIQSAALLLQAILRGPVPIPVLRVAFFAALDLPSAFDAVEASMLTGEKSLLNDKPLLPFIQQLCSASLRHFQSLPDGRFYGFYPDYFGEMNQHPPYWNIDDVEILDGQINNLRRSIGYPSVCRR